MGRHRDRRGASVRVHALQDEALVIQLRQDRVAAAGHATERAAFDDLGHVHCQAGREPQHRRQRREYGGVTRSACDDDVHVGGECAAKRSHAHLPDDMGGFGDVFASQVRHAVEACDPTGTQRLEQLRPRQVGADHRHAKMPPLDAGDVAQHPQCRVQMGRGAGRTGGSDDQRDIQLPGGKQDAPQVAAGRLGGGRHLALAQIGGSDVNRAHVAADEVRAALQAGAERCGRDAVAELAGRAQQPDRAAGAVKLGDDAA